MGRSKSTKHKPPKGKDKPAVTAQLGQEAQLQDHIAGFFSDPLGFVYYLFPWGEQDSRLAKEDGPDVWQIEVLKALGEGTLSPEDAIQIAVASGHGVGKTTLVAWIILWFMSTRPHPQVVVTANTMSQLNTKTWRELAKWHKMAINRHWFTWTATKFYNSLHPETWFAASIPWSKENSEAFAGTHEEHVLIIFDESSSIDDIIWEVTEGAMTTPGAVWCVFGNPTRNTGRFRQCFGKFKARWKRFQVDSRSAKMANSKKLDEWIRDYGDDSDFCRVRIKGMFPRASGNQFIGVDLIEKAKSNIAYGYESMPKIVAVDIARQGGDDTVFTKRQGSKVWKQIRLHTPDLMTIVGVLTQMHKEFKPDAIFLDATGMGSGVYDRCKQVNLPAIPVFVGEKATDQEIYYNLRAEIWGKMKVWLQEGDADISEDDIDLEDDLVGIEYGFDARERIQLERKEHMKERGLASPDGGDSLALSFYHPVIVQQKSVAAGRAGTDWSTG